MARPEPILVADHAGLAEIRSLWQRLLSPWATPFQVYSWNCAWYRNFAADYDAIQVFVSGDRKVIFPLYRIGRTLRLAGDRICDYQDAIGSSHEAVVGALRELLEWAGANGLTLHLERLSERGLLYRAIRELRWEGLSFPVIERPIGPCPTFRLGDDTEESLAHLRRKFRAELRRQHKRIQRDFPGAELETRDAKTITAD